MLPLILAIVMAGAVLTIVFLLFQHLGRQKEDLSEHTAEMDNLKDEIEQEQVKLKEAAAAENKLRQDLRLSKETAENLQKELAVKDKLYEELKAKYTQAEKDLHAKQDEITALEQRNKKPEEPKIEERKEELKPEKPQEQPEPEKPKEEQPKQRPKPEEPKPEEKKEGSPFSRFLKPKISEEEAEDSPEENNKLEQPI